MHAGQPGSPLPSTAPHLPDAVRRASTAVVVAQILSQIISLTVLATLFRLVAPDQFGLLGMVLPPILIARNLAALGLNVATVQRPTLSTGQLSSVFWLQLATGTLLALAIAACGPLLAILYKTPEVTPVTMAMSGLIIVASVGTLHEALLQRNLRFRPLVVARVFAQIVGGVAGITAALGGLGIWALVLQQFVEQALITFAVWVLEPWRPDSPGLGSSIWPLVQFGSLWTASNLLFALAQHIDKILLALVLGGTRSGLAALGLYTQAFNLMIKPVYLVTTPLTSIMLPALSRAAADAGGKMAHSLLINFYRVVGIVLLPCGVGLLLVGPDVMHVLGGDAWRGSGPILSALSLTILVQGFIIIAGFVLSSAGRADRLVYGSLAYLLVMTSGCGLAVGIAAVGGYDGTRTALTVAAGVSVASLLFVWPYTMYCLHSVMVPAAQILAALRAPAWAAVMMGLAVFLIGLVFPTASAAGRMVILIACGALIYALLARKEIRWVVDQFSAGGRAITR